MLRPADSEVFADEPGGLSSCPLGAKFGFGGERVMVDRDSEASRLEGSTIGGRGRDDNCAAISEGAISGSGLNEATEFGVDVEDDDGTRCGSSGGQERRGGNFSLGG